MAKHTPGPWRKLGDYVHVVVDGQDMALVQPSAMFIGREAMEANARLIAAAPDLLTSLKEFVASLIKHATYGLSDEEVAMLKRGEAAIARAEGG